MTQPPPFDSRPDHRDGRPAKTKKPTWVIDKERARRASAAETVWLFGLHAVRDALANPARQRLRLVLTRNAADRLGGAVPASGMTPEIVDARTFDRAAPLADALLFVRDRDLLAGHTSVGPHRADWLPQ